MPRGTFFLGQEAQPLGQDVPRCVQVSVMGRAAPWTGPLAHRQRHLAHDVPAGRAGLARRVPARDLDQPPAAHGELVLELAHQLAEGGVGHRPREAMVRHHALGAQVLRADGLVFARQRGRRLVQGVPPLVRNSLVHARHLDALPLPVSRPLLLAGQPSLLARELSLRLRQSPRVLEDLACARHRERLDADVDADGGAGRRRRQHRHAGAAQGHEVLSARRLLDRGRQDAAFRQARHAGLDAPELRQLDVLGVDDLDDVGAVRAAAIAARLEPGEADLAGRPEEVAVRAVEVAQRLLKRHRVGVLEPRGLGVGLPRRQHLDALDDARHLLPALVRRLAQREGAVVDEAAAAEGPRDLLSLGGVGVDAVLVRELHQPIALLPSRGPVFWFSMYCLIIDSGAPPTVETK